MATSVKVNAETKSELEELQAEIRLRTGRKVTQQELLARLVEEAAESKADLVESFRDEPSVEDADKSAFHAGMVSSGRSTTESDIDEELYG